MKKKGVSTDFSRAERISILNETGICWQNIPDIPWSFSYYFTEAGQSNFHIYLWLCKDLSWVQGWYYCGYIFGSLSLGFQLFILYKSLRVHNIGESCINLTLLLWLFGLFWWMIGELHDIKYPNQRSQYNKHTRESGYIDIAALTFIVSYFSTLIYIRLYRTKHEHVSVDENHKEERYKRSTSTPPVPSRFSFLFHNWKEYESVHVLFWLAKDTAWNWGIPIMLMIFFIPTFLLSADFVMKTFYLKYGLIDHAHYCAQLLWICYTTTWALGEFYVPNHDEPISMIKWNSEAKITVRWYASWVLFAAFIPIILLHIIWIRKTCDGSIGVTTIRTHENLYTYKHVSYSEFVWDGIDESDNENQKANNQNGDQCDDDKEVGLKIEHSDMTLPLLNK